MKNNQISYWLQSNSLKKAAFIIHVFIQFFISLIVIFLINNYYKNIVIFETVVVENRTVAWGLSAGPD